MVMGYMYLLAFIRKKNQQMNYKFTILLFAILLMSCKSKEESESKLSFPTEDSFKEKLNKDEGLKSQILFDEKSKIYTNNLYNISMDFPDNWEVDMGTSENSLVRGVQKDSGITFIVVPIELQKGSRTYNLQSQLLDAYDSDKKMYEKVMTDNLEKLIGQKVLNYETEKSYLKNQKTIKSKYETVMRDLDVEYNMTTITQSFWRPPYSFTISLSLPSIWYEENPQKYNWIFSNFFFTK
jgi:hypothetical protein